MKHEVYIFSDKLDTKQNFFLTKVLQKYRNFRQRDSEEEPYAYISMTECRLLLGSVLHPVRIDELIRLGFIEKVCIGQTKYGRDIFGYIPKVTEYKRQKMAHKVITNYYQRKHSSLSKIAKKVFKFMSHSTIDVTREEFELMGDEMYKSYLLRADKAIDKVDYNKYLINLWESIEDYNTMNMTERVEYVTEDDFGNRLHSIFSSLPKALRRRVLVWGEENVELDLCQSQPVILAQVLEEEMGDNSFTRLIRSGEDVYRYISPDNRDKGKKALYFTLFGKRTPKSIIKLFPDIEKTIKNLKWKRVEGNPSEKKYSNLAYKLQQKESMLFRQVWTNLIKENISFIPVHDSVMVQDKYMNKALRIMNRTLLNKLPRVDIRIDIGE
tara:strand:- start:11435 stop:12580 length:1146 start_codon:yes stop_codon:yes gene_type:complete